MGINTYEIGDVVMSPHEKMKNEDGLDRFDLLLADGSEVSESEHPVLWETLGMTYQETILGTEGLLGYYPLDTQEDMSGLHNQGSDIIAAGQGEVSPITGIKGAKMPVHQNLPDDGGVASKIILPSGTASVELLAKTYILQSGEVYSVAFTLYDSFPEYTTNRIRVYSYPESDDLDYSSEGFGIVADVATYGEWHHYVVQNEDGVVKFYIDGELSVTDTASDVLSMFSLQLGCGVNSSGYYGGGTSNSDVAFYNRPLTPAEIQQRITLGPVYRPTISSGSDLVPYRVVVDKHTPSIGEVRPTNLEKYSEDGVAMFDYLLCDGSEVLEIEHPLYYSYLLGLPPAYMADNSFFEGSSSPWSFSTSYFTWSEGEFKANTTSTYKRLAQSLDSPMVKGKTYKVTVVCTQYTSGSLYVRQPRDGVASDLDRAVTGVGTFTWNIKATDSGGATDLTNVSLSTNDGTAGGGLGAKLTISSFTVEELMPSGVYRPINTSAYPNFPDRVIADLTE